MDGWDGGSGNIALKKVQTHQAGSVIFSLLELSTSRPCWPRLSIVGFLFLNVMICQEIGGWD
jgi:hypothetical protein